MITPLLPTYARIDLAFERGEGARVYTADGTEFLDFSAGIAVNSLGHAHPHLVAALTEQAGKIWHTSNAVRIPQQERLAARLAAATFADTMFITNSGTEAIECAIKMARRYHWAKGNPERYRLITFEGAFHGRTLAAIAAGGQEKYLEGFGPAVEGFDQVPFGDLDAVKAAITPETAGILIEPVQGEGGLRALPAKSLRALRELCDEKGILLILDEIQCGVGRTGYLFAHQASGITPDIMAIAKGIGGGFPIGACLATEEAASGMVAGTHGSTFGGNPLACAVGNAVLDVVLGEGFLQHVRDIALRLRQGLAGLQDAHPGSIEEIRGEGLMLGIKCKVPNKDVLAAMRERKMLAVAAGDNVVRLLPPLIIDEKDVADALERLDGAFSAVEAEAQGDAA
ncbi:MAG: aspartate aminotransferase family protein [Rhodobiaceae bacterium]|nr:aspartate aminotransferase family protein [Rhodobiaceae bacterium]MCC0050150.1 aspartate aminotransferase family protein [Rhodobiaceae bacterium]